MTAPRTFKHFSEFGTQEEWKKVHAIVNDLAYECTNFFAARRLKEFLNEKGKELVETNWSYSAFENSIFAISNFISVLNFLSEQPCVKKFNAGHSATIKAKQEIRALFPDARAMRDAIAHPEVYSRRAAKTVAKTAIQLEGLPVTIGPGVCRRIVINDWYICTFEGRVCTHQLSDAVGEKLEALIADLAEPFLE